MIELIILLGISAWMCFASITGYEANYQLASWFLLGMLWIQQLMLRLIVKEIKKALNLVRKVRGEL